ncbi:MAG TPA: LCP family protein [Phototrophicaceae bacterium]|nr:LCP family protein [Phototrophicaceae bacterium]
MRIPGWLLVVGLVLVVLLTGGMAILAFSIARETAIGLGRGGVDLASSVEQIASTIPTPTPLPTIAPVVTVATPLPGETALPTVAMPTPPAATLDPAASYTWSDPHRITVLLMGIDQRKDVDDKGLAHTDTMMVISVDPVRKTAGVLSIPRDLWVKIPRFYAGAHQHRQSAR